MAIKVNGTTITDVKVNGTSVDTVKVGSTIVFQKVKIKKWIYITRYSSNPQIQNTIYETGRFGNITEIIAFLESNYPASNYDIGKNAIVYNFNSGFWNVFEVQNA